MYKKKKILFIITSRIKTFEEVLSKKSAAYSVLPSPKSLCFWYYCLLPMSQFLPSPRFLNVANTPYYPMSFITPFIYNPSYNHYQILFVVASLPKPDNNNNNSNDDYSWQTK